MQFPITLRILDTHYITHDVKQFILEKPKNFLYSPGQAAHISINTPGWEKEKRPFTFTSVYEWDYLEFTIKIYPERNGMTNQLQKINAGGSLIIQDVFDTVKYKGPGVFIAGGTGITPFIAIFRALYLSNNMRDIALIYSNKSAEDVILYEELKQMLGNNFINVFTKQGVIGFQEKRIDKSFLVNAIHDFDERFYVCGSIDFVNDISRYLIELGAAAHAVIV